MNIAGQAYQDGQEDRKASGMQRTAEALERLAMAKYTHTGLDFQHWQHYRANWMSGYQFVEDVSKEQASANTADDTIYTLVPSSNRGHYALDDPQHGRDIESGDSLAILLASQWIEGDIEHKANLCAIEHGPRLVSSGYYFNARDGSKSATAAPIENPWI